MDAVTFLETRIPRFLAAGILIPPFVIIAAFGATPEEIAAEETRIGLTLSDRYRRFLLRWNGMNLDVMRFFGVGEVLAGISWQNVHDGPDGIVFIASDPAGFTYGEDRGGRILSFDHDGGASKMVSDNFDTFVIWKGFPEFYGRGLVRAGYDNRLTHPLATFAG